MNKVLRSIRKAIRFFRYDPSIIFNKLGIAKFSHEEGLFSYFARAKIIIDGRDNNLKFLKKNLKRKYSFRKNYTRNINTIELIS